MRALFLSLPLLLVATNANAQSTATETATTTATATPTTASTSASTPTDLDPAAVSEAQTTYFHGERNQGYFWGGVGGAALVAGGALYFDDHPASRGASYPILIVGAIQTFIGVLSFARPAGRIARNDEQIKQSPRVFLDAEIERVHLINRAFPVIEALEGAAVVTGIALGGAGLLGRDESMQGVGLGLAVQGTAMFILDAFAHARAERYEKLLRVMGAGMPF